MQSKPEVTRKDAQEFIDRLGLEIEYEWQWRLLLHFLNDGPPYEIRAAKTYVETSIDSKSELLHEEVRIKNPDGTELRYYKP